MAPLPLAALRLEPGVLDAAGRFGLERVADLLPMPRGPLARRLGLAAVTRLDQALGRAAEPIVGLVPFEPPHVERRLLEPIGTAEAIATVIADLIGDLVATLRTRGLGARALVLSLDRLDLGIQTVTIGTARATRDAAHLQRLFALKIDRIDPGLGIEAMRLVVPRADPLGSETLVGVLAGGCETPDVAPLVDQLVGRAGADALFRIAPLETDIPERAVRKVDPMHPAGQWPAWLRPARLLPHPELLTGVVALLPDTPPRRFAWRGRTHVVVAGDGPERVHGEWWVRDAEIWGVRDYFRVEDQDGGRFWLFRRGDGEHADTGSLSWHMHGVFG